MHMEGGLVGMDSPHMCRNQVDQKIKQTAVGVPDNVGKRMKVWQDERQMG